MVACGSTTITLGQPTFRAGVARNLNCTAGTGGVGAGSGVVTVLKNHQGTNATQAITATFGTGTTASDTAHTFSYAPGDILGIQVTSAASETRLLTRRTGSREKQCRGGITCVW